MKILSDFDGVMTDQTDEGLHEFRLFRDKLVELSRHEAAAVDALLDDVGDELRAHPTRHGWWSRGRVSAYADEDLFIKVIGTAVALDQRAQQGHEVAASLVEDVRQGDFANLAAVSDWAYSTLVADTRSGKIQPMDQVVRTALETLLEKGHEVVVVSNSSTKRVVELLRTIGLDPRTHDEAPDARFRVRGDARKFELGDEDRAFELDGFRFDVARPAYRTILTEEVPDVVIGDVFSLDLALPLALTREDPETFGGMHILLRTRPYTPEWSRRICTRTDEAHAKLGLLDDYGKLPGIIGA